MPEKYDEALDLKLVPCVDAKIKQHVFIEGDNYPVLKILERDFNSKIDFIYIDPPYNTGNAFTYEDDFSLKKDRHSAWLSFMSRRLKLAKELLKDDGCIFIAIDQSELYVLKLLCDSIFGEDNFVNDFMWLHGKGKKDTWSRTLQQHTLCYGKNKKLLKPFVEIEYSDWAKTNADGDERGNWFSGSISFSETRSNPNHRNYYSIKSPSGKVWTRQWMVSEEEMQALLKENKIFFGKAPEYSGVPRVKIFNNEPTEVIPKNIINCVDSTRKAQKHLDDLLEEKAVFDNPKPVDLISHLISIVNKPKDIIVMDFFAGSGTTFEAVAEMNSKDNGCRKCILVQKPEVVNKDSDSKYGLISDICRARVEKVSKLYNETVEYCKLQVM